MNCRHTDSFQVQNYYSEEWQDGQGFTLLTRPEKNDRLYLTIKLNVK